MSDSKAEAIETLAQAGSVGTYQTFVRPHQLKRGDTYTEAGIPRSVVIEKVTHGEIPYRGFLAPVLFVYGYDVRLKHTVRYTKTSWEFMEVTRIGDAPQYQRVIKSLDQFVY